MPDVQIRTLTLPTAVIMGPILPPAPVPDPERGRWFRKMGHVCAITRGPVVDTSSVATMRRLEAATILRPILQAEARAAMPTPAPGTRPATQQTTSALAMTDTIVSVAPNPKKPGSSTRERYEHWRVGETLTQARARGLTMADIKWDIEHGFVVVRSAVA